MYKRPSLRLYRNVDVCIVYVCVCTPAHVLPYSTPWPVYLELDAIEMSAASEIAGAEALDAAGAAVVTLESV